MVEGALVATRRHAAEPQGEVSKLRFALRRARPAEEAAEPPLDDVLLDRGAHAA